MQSSVGQSLLIRIDDKHNESIQSLIQTFLAGDTDQVSMCGICNKDTTHSVKDKMIASFPRTLIILLSRYENKQTKYGVNSFKIQNRIAVSDQGCSLP